MSMNHQSYRLPVILLVLFPSTASANAGTALMWASMLHLTFGNAIIGLLEGWLLSSFFKTPKKKTVLILIAANYASAWLGGGFITGYLASLPDITIETILFWFLCFIAVAFVVTLLIEFPFFWFALRKTEQSLRKVIAATLLIHGISYVLLLGWYWLASGTSMMTGLEVVSSAEMRPPEPYTLYFISQDGECALGMELNKAGTPAPISNIAAQHRNDRLFVRHREGSGFDLHVFLDSNAKTKGDEELLLENFSDLAPVDWVISQGHSKVARGTWFNFGPVPDISKASSWEFETGFWPVEGLRGENKKTGEKIRFSLELPFVAWTARNATHLNGDFVVFQLGDDQICIMHPPSGKIALIARGKGPIVAKPNQPLGVLPRSGRNGH